MPKKVVSRPKGGQAQKPGKPNNEGFLYRWRRQSHKPGKGGVLKKTSGLGRLIRWPKYVKMQRQRKVLFQRLKTPATLNVFLNPARATLAGSLVKLFGKYRVESRKQKKEREQAKAKLQAENKPIPGNKPNLVEFGLNRITNLIESKKVKLVLIAHDVDPIELVLWMPVLCKKKNVPFAVVKGRARLGTLCRQKTASCVALCDVDAKDQEEFLDLIRQVTERFNDRLDQINKKRGQRQLGVKTRHKIQKRQRLRQQEMKKRQQAKGGTEA